MSELLSALSLELSAGRDLSPEQAAQAAAALAAEQETEDAKALFLSCLSRKGETSTEIAAFAQYFRGVAKDPGLGAWSSRAVDIVGTGGDHAGGFNISTLVTLVLAASGVPVIKHGNRGITSKCGSADLFSGLGVVLDAPPPVLARAIQELGYVFLFAPSWHPAFRSVAPVRKALAAKGERTVFNILGPLLNPGRPAHMLLGAASISLAEKLADALQVLGTPAGLAVHGVIAPGRGIDELTSATANVVRGAGRLRYLREEWTPESMGLKASPFSDLIGGEISVNLAIAGALADGGGPAGLADTIALNASVCLWMCGLQANARAGIEQARELLLGGAVKRKIEQTRDFYASGRTRG